ncbi:tetratricopeptide repeat protein [Streptomyces sp. NPDC006622]|uniref:tetratricopeptide repeat protein n=1 Tax=Streptomyces sp. NPDC006622 TaxID=3155459 RepID=UPI0033A6C020
MSPRTNDGEPERERPASGPGTAASAERTASGEATGLPPTDRPKGTGGIAETGETTESDETHPTDGTDETEEAVGTGANEAARETGVTDPSEIPAVQEHRENQAARKTGRAEAAGKAGVAGSDGADGAGCVAGTDDAARADGVDGVDGERIAAVRRVAAAGRRWRAVHLGACAAMLAVGLTAGAIAVGAARDGEDTPVAAAAAVSPGLFTGADLGTGIASLQTHLRDQPRDFSGWATLGLAYVEQARVQGDPSRYPQAEKALKRSLALRPDNDQALSGRAALAAARHQFTDALALADRALEQNPYNERALCSRTDALVELGRYEEAAEAARTADERRPGVPVFTRYAYVHELRGDVTTARRVLDRALAASTTPGDIAYVATQLGQLAWNQGDQDTALAHYARALAADENYLPALEGRARAQAASGRRAEAIEGLEDVVARFPLPGPLVELGELYEVRGGKGDAAKAAAQYRLVDAWTALARANGVNADLDTALAAADHGDGAAALRAARAEWDRRRTVHTADALAWALHVNGRDDEALPYARRATATGYRSAAFLYHRGVVERATGRPKDARTHLTAALRLNPGFSALGAREARTALKTLEAAK